MGPVAYAYVNRIGQEEFAKICKKVRCVNQKMDMSNIFFEVEKRIDSIFKKVGENGRFVGPFSTKMRQFYIQTTLFLSDLSIIEAPLKAEQIFDVAIQSARSENIDLKAKMSKQGSDLVKTELCNIEYGYENQSNHVMVITKKLEAAKLRKNTSELEVEKLVFENAQLQKRIDSCDTQKKASKENPLMEEILKIEKKINTTNEEISEISRELYVKSSQFGKECELLEDDKKNLEQQLHSIERNIKYANYMKPPKIFEPIVPNHKIKSARVQKARVPQIPTRSPRNRINNELHVSVNKLSNLNDQIQKNESEPANGAHLQFQRFTIVQRVPRQVSE